MKSSSCLPRRGACAIRCSALPNQLAYESMPYVMARLVMTQVVDRTCKVSPISMGLGCILSMLQYL